MAHRAFMQIAKNIPLRFKESAKEYQRFQNLLILDFEATCDDKTPLIPQEIIEFPCIVLSTEDWKVKDVFHEYVKPKYHPNITSFCTELTGIIQETVDNQPYFPEIFSKFTEWLEHQGYFQGESRRSAFVTSGDWDLKVMLPKQCELYNIPIPEYFHEWIDLKKTFCLYTKNYPRGLQAMMNQLNLKFTGRLHSGIDDSHNMSMIIRILNERYRANFTINSTIHQTRKLK